MTGYLLDTQVFLWWLADDDRASSGARTIVESERRVVVSDVSLLELSIEAAAGKFEADPDVLRWFERSVTSGRFASLPIERPHLARTATLPRHHRDPFDRLLVAQAEIEGLALVSSDPTLDAYDVQRVW